MTGVGFMLTVATTDPEEGSIYSETLPPVPVPRVGEEVFVGGDAHGYWRVVAVEWLLPQLGAHSPAMWPTLRVMWSESNRRPRPVWSEEDGWRPVPDAGNAR